MDVDLQKEFLGYVYDRILTMPDGKFAFEDAPSVADCAELKDRKERLIRAQRILNYFIEHNDGLDLTETSNTLILIRSGLQRIDELIFEKVDKCTISGGRRRRTRGRKSRRHRRKTRSRR